MQGAVHAGKSVRLLKIPVFFICSAALLAVEALHQVLWQHLFCIPASHFLKLTQAGIQAFTLISLHGSYIRL